MVQVEPQYRSLLGKIGFMACRNCRYEEAWTIFDGLRASDPAKAGPYIGLAMVLLSQGKTADAVGLLKNDALKAVPDDRDVKAYLGLAYYMSKQPDKAKEVLGPLAMSVEGSLASSLARTLLEQVK